MQNSRADRDRLGRGNNRSIDTRNLWTFGRKEFERSAKKARVDSRDDTVSDESFVLSFLVSV